MVCKKSPVPSAIAAELHLTGKKNPASLTDRRATVPPIVKTVYLLHRKSCTRFGLNFSLFLLCQMKIPNEKNSRHVYLLRKKCKQTSSSPFLATVGLKYSSSKFSPNLPPVWVPGSIRQQNHSHEAFKTSMGMTY